MGENMNEIKQIDKLDESDKQIEIGKKVIGDLLWGLIGWIKERLGIQREIKWKRL
jgi:hypothetical protein